MQINRFPRFSGFFFFFFFFFFICLLLFFCFCLCLCSVLFSWFILFVCLFVCLFVFKPSLGCRSQAKKCSVKQKLIFEVHIRFFGLKSKCNY